MKKLIATLFAIVLVFSSAFAQHNAGNNGKVLLIASNKSINKQTGWDIGVWYAELTHPYWVFNEAGYSVDIASPDGGELYFDGFSDPEDASRYAAFDYISLGFKTDPNKMAHTPWMFLFLKPTIKNN
jgi:putative intracellular protease/amidase